MTDNQKLIYAVNQAMIGVNIPRLKEIWGSYTPTRINVIFYFLEEITEEDEEMASIAGTEIIAQYSGNELIYDECLFWNGQAAPNTILLYTKERNLTDWTN